MKKLEAVALAIALLTACGGEADSPVAIAAAESPATTAPESPATTAPEIPTTVATTTSAAPTTTMTENLVYHPGGEPFATKSGKVDVIAPTQEGSWPTVVVFHGDPRAASKTWHRSDARQVAEQGRVVFLPAWGHFDRGSSTDMDARGAWDLNAREVKCAVAFAKEHTAAFGGDPDHITVYGLSAGGNAVLMAGLSDAEPLESCAAEGPSVDVQALVPIDADWTMGGGWDFDLSEDPEAFYSVTPWRWLDGSHDIPIHVMVTEIVGPYTRTVGPEPAQSWLSYRHPDIDLVADLTERGFLNDGEFSLRESGEYAHQVLTEAGYDSSLTVMPGAKHESWGEEGTAVVVETVLNAAR